MNEMHVASTGGSDMAGADREDLEQLERAVRGRLLEVQILKLSVQCRAAQSQFESYLDVANSAVKPKVNHQFHRCAAPFWRRLHTLVLGQWQKIDNQHTT